VRGEDHRLVRVGVLPEPVLQRLELDQGTVEGVPSQGGSTAPPTTSGARGSSRTSPIPLRQQGRPAGLQWSVKVLDVTPDGRGTDWHPRYRYDS